MADIITSPSKRWPGTVTLAPLTFPRLIAFETALDAAQQAGNNMRGNYALLPGLVACVETWALEGFPANVTAETFPAAPIGESVKVISWLMDEVSARVQEAAAVPNE
jgi:hypothetical protein